MVETITLQLPGELVERIKHEVSPSQPEMERFFIEAARKQLRELRIKQLRAEYDTANTRRSPREVYDATRARVAGFEKKHGMDSDEFMKRYRSGEIQERDDNWEDLQEWRFAYLGLLRLEEKLNVQREG